jgi:hypothetical protein
MKTSTLKLLSRASLAAAVTALWACGGAEVMEGADETAPFTTESLTSTLTIGTTLSTTDNLNFRTGPGTSHSIIEVIPVGTPVSTVNRTTPSNGFYNIWYAGKVGWSSGLYLKVAAAPSAATLNTSVVSKIVEPPGSGNDDKGNSYTDKNYWNFCAPGAVTAALSTFTSAVTSWPAGYFREPHGPFAISTYWASSDSVSGYSTVGRAYLMHIALQSKPPNFTYAGLASFSTYPTTGSSLSDSRDVLNWEASGHASGWSSFFYEIVGAGSLASSTLHNDIKRDISGGHALVAAVNTAYLPNWSRSLMHSIAIVGYDDAAGTYKYIDTCGIRCNGSSASKNGGVWSISQSKLHSAIVSAGSGYIR